MSKIAHEDPIAMIRTLPALSFRVSALVSVAALLAPQTSAQTFGSDFAADYTFTDLGAVPGVPTPLGGVVFKLGDPDTLLIGGDSNNVAGAIYEIGVTRDAGGRIDGFSGTASLFATAPEIDGGLVYAPNGTLLFTAYPTNWLGQILPGSGAVDKWVDLTTAGITSSVGACQFVPTGFDGVGEFKLVSFNTGDWFDAALVPDGSGTFDLGVVTYHTSLPGGPEGIVYIDGTNPGFSGDSILLAEWTAGQVGAYELDASGEPDPATRRDFMTGLSGAEGAVTDPLTGDFLFSTFGGGDRVLVVHGFDAPHTYCQGKVASTGRVPRVHYAGTPSLSGPDDFILTCTEAPNHVFGVMVWSLVPDTAPFYGGILCVSSPSYRLPVQGSGGSPGVATDSSGTFSDHLDQAFFTSKGFTSGTTVYCQYIGRDPGYAWPGNVLISEGLVFTVRD